MTSKRRRYVALTSLRRHVPAGNLLPPLGPPNILYLPTPMKICLNQINEDMVQILLMLEVLFTQDSEVEDLFRGAFSGSEPGLFFSSYLFGLGFKPIQDDFQQDFARVTDEAESSLLRLSIHDVSWAELSLMEPIPPQAVISICNKTFMICSREYNCTETKRVVHLLKRTETSLITESDQSRANHQLLLVNI